MRAEITYDTFHRVETRRDVYAIPADLMPADEAASYVLIRAEPYRVDTIDCYAVRTVEPSALVGPPIGELASPASQMEASPADGGRAG